MSLFLSFLLFAGSAGAPTSWHWDWHKAQGCRLALAFAAAVGKSPCSPPSVHSSSMEGLRAIAQSPPWPQALPHPGVIPREERGLRERTSRTSLPCGLLLPRGSPAAPCSGGFSAPLSHGADVPAALGGDTAHICRLFALSPSPRGRKDCVQWTLLVCFAFPVCVYIFLYMRMWKHGYRYRPRFPSFCLPSHSQVNSSRHAALSPAVSEAV